MNIDAIYNITVREIAKWLGTNGITDSLQLTKLGKHLFGQKWSGVYAADQKANWKGSQRYAIYNLDPSYLGGSHWVSVIKENGKILFYDSFGRPAKQILPDLGGSVVNTEPDAEQTDKQENCGQRALSAIFIYDQFGKAAFLKL